MSRAENPLISILTPAYRSETTIARAVRSAQQQTYPHWEMLIVSDDGVDYQQVLAAQGITDARLKFGSTGQIGAGVSRGRNVALEMAHGEFITTLDADDEYHPDYLSVMLAGAQEYGVAMVWLAHQIKADGSIRNIGATIANPAAYVRFLTLADYVKANGCTVTIFARKLLHHRYDEDIIAGEDYYFDLQLMDRVGKVPVYRHDLYIYHYNPDSITNQPDSDEAFVDNYKNILQRVEQNLQLSPRLKHSLLATYHHRLFQNYLYLNAKADGKCADFFEFMEKYPEHFK